MLTGQSSSVHVVQAAVKYPKQPAVPCGQGRDYTTCLFDHKNKVDPGKENCRGVYYNQNRACNQ